MKNRPKLIFFVAVDWFFVSHFLSRAIAAREAGYEVVVLTRVTQCRKIIEATGLRIIPLTINRKSLSPLDAVLTVARVWRIYRREKADIVHQVALKPIVLGGLSAWLARVPGVVNAVVGGGYVITASRWTMRMVRPFLRLGLKLLLNPKGSLVIFENRDDLAFFVSRNFVRQESAILIRGAGVDPEAYRTECAPPGTPMVVLVARLLWDKGIGEFVEAARLLRARGIPGRFVVIGGADPDNRSSIDSSTLERWRAESSVEFWGFREDIPKILETASIACLPSYREGLPKSLLEAMAAGLPCVTTDVPGCREVVRDGDNGILIPPRNPEALADALTALLRDPEMRKRMGRRGRERVVAEFSEQRVIAETLAVYRRMRAE